MRSSIPYGASSADGPRASRFRMRSFRSAGLCVAGGYTRLDMKTRKLLAARGPLKKDESLGDERLVPA
jgi:hypothetical protein